ncbi:MAG TPA: cytochrome c [Anaerolineae bacterium]|nr:cytochrome c [Anaerolineae bacterium]
MKKHAVLVLILFTAVLAACAAPGVVEESTAVPENTPVIESAATAAPRQGMGVGNGMGPGNSMMARHMAVVPDEYAGFTNPVPADEESLARGAETYANLCATCHGDGGMGDGPAGVSLDPAPAPVAHTSQMLGDDYLFWRISEGGAMEPFNSAMIAWKDSLDEEARWDVINYVRALGSGQAAPGRRMGGAMFDPAAEATKQAEMLAAAVLQGVITQAEADTFTAVHTELDAVMAGQRGQMQGGMADMQAEMLAELVADGRITQAQADQFNDIHDRLLAVGLMQ